MPYDPLPHFRDNGTYRGVGIQDAPTHIISIGIKGSKGMMVGMAPKELYEGMEGMIKGHEWIGEGTPVMILKNDEPDSASGS